MNICLPLSPIRLAGTLLASLALLVSAGCNSQLDDIDVPDFTSPGDVAFGVFRGVTSFQVAATENPATVIISPDGRMVIVGDDTEFLASGLFQTVNRGINAQIRFHVPNVFDEDGAPLVPASAGDLIGSFQPQAEVSATFVRDDGEAGSVNVAYEDQTELVPDLEAIAGSWVVQDVFGDASTRLLFSDSGQFTGEDANGCNYLDGATSIVDPRYNLYRVEFARICPGGTGDRELFIGLLTVLELREAGRTVTRMIFGGANAEFGVALRLAPGA